MNKNKNKKGGIKQEKNARSKKGTEKETTTIGISR